MKPLPAQKFAGQRASGELIPSLPTIVSSHHGSFSNSNRRAVRVPSPQAYPWLLAASTAIAGLFCFMYITKPVILSPASQANSASIQQAAPKPAGISPSASSLMPSVDRLPGEKSPTSPAKLKTTQIGPGLPLPNPSSSPAFEETNLRIQHILTAEAPGGHLDRIDIDVPVLYQSRSLRWTPQEIEQARGLLVRLTDYQEKSRQLRSEGIQLLDSWNQLVGRSIPSAGLRADSPTLPANQEQMDGASHSGGLNSSDSIQIQPSEK